VIVLAALAGLCIYGIFLIGPIWIVGIFICRQNAWWDEQDKVSTYFEIHSPRMADFLIGKYGGYSTCIRTNIPLFYNEFRINRYPARLSALGAANYAITIVFAIWYAVGITAYFFFGWTDNFLVPSGILLLMVQTFVFTILCNWNKSCVEWDKYEIISKQEMKRRRRHHGT